MKKIIRNLEIFLVISPSVFAMSKALFVFKEGAYNFVCDRFKNKLQRRSWQKDAGETGLAPEARLPYAGASISYEFYSYLMKTKYGDLTLTGTCTFKNTFMPMLENNMCHFYIPAYRLAQKALPIVQGAAIAGGLLLAAPAAGPAAFGSLTKITSILAVSTGGLLTTTAAYSETSYDTNKSLPIQSEDRSISVIFSGFTIIGSK